MSSEITPESRVIVISGDSVLDRETIAQMVARMIPDGPAIPAAPLNPEHSAWNAAVDERKAAKRRAKEAA